MLSVEEAATLLAAQRICHDLAQAAAENTRVGHNPADATALFGGGYVFGLIAGQAEAAAGAIFNVLDSVETHLDAC